MSGEADEGRGDVTIASWNVLADGYLEREWYQGCDPAHLDPRWRRPAVLRGLLELDADVLCCQEVDSETFAEIGAGLAEHGYRGSFAQKRHGKPDGSATWVRAERFPQIGFRSLAFDDPVDGVTSGHVVLFADLQGAGRGAAPLTVANAHLKWDRPGDPPRAWRGRRQVEELLARWTGGASPDPDGLVVCGDFNAVSASEVASALTDYGLRDVYAARPDDATCNANSELRRIDFIFCGPGWESKVRPTPPLGASTRLPCAEHPSDHLAIRAELSRRAAARRQG